jgi:Na+/melibiose symporter-like transporter
VKAVTNWVFVASPSFFIIKFWVLSGSLTGLAVLIAIIFDAISDPVMGSISDRYVSKLGRRHPFMFAAPFPTVIAIYLCSFPQMDYLNMALWVAYFFYHYVKT